MKYKYLLVILCACLLLSCSDPQDEDIDRARISNIIRDIEYSFNQHDATGFDASPIMQYYAEYYLNNGENKINAQSEWTKRANRFSSMKTEIHNIDVSTTPAEVRLTVTFLEWNSSSPFIYTDPGTYGDLSYFCNDDVSGWVICGNQEGNTTP